VTTIQQRHRQTDGRTDKSCSWRSLKINIKAWVQSKFKSSPTIFTMKFVSFTHLHRLINMHKPYASANYCHCSHTWSIAQRVMSQYYWSRASSAWLQRMQYNMDHGQVNRLTTTLAKESWRCWWHDVGWLVGQRWTWTSEGDCVRVRVSEWEYAARQTDWHQEQLDVRERKVQSASNSYLPSPSLTSSSNSHGRHMPPSVPSFIFPRRHRAAAAAAAASAARH